MQRDYAVKDKGEQLLLDEEWVKVDPPKMCECEEIEEPKVCECDE